MKDESLKGQIKIVLGELRAKGFGRDTIEKELGYSENYIDQQLSKGGNNRLLNAITKLNNRILQKAIPDVSNIDQPPPAGNSIDDLAHSNRILAESNAKMVDAILQKLSLLDSIKLNLEQTIPGNMAALTKTTIDGQKEAVGAIMKQFESLNNNLSNLATAVNKKTSQNQKRGVNQS